MVEPTTKIRSLLVRDVLTVAGFGSILVTPCDDAGWVRDFLDQGLDAYASEVNDPAVRAALGVRGLDSLAEGRNFDTVLALDRASAEAAGRHCNRTLIVFAPHADLVEVEDRIFQLGFERHPTYRRSEWRISPSCTAIVARKVREPFALASSAGVQADAKVARLQAVARFIRPHDRFQLLGADSFAAEILRLAGGVARADGELPDFILHEVDPSTPCGLDPSAVTPGGRLCLLGQEAGLGATQARLTAGGWLPEATLHQVNGGSESDDGARFEPDPPKGNEPWVMVMMRNPVRGETVPYRETVYEDAQPPPNLLDFEGNYSNPWLLRSLVEFPFRTDNPALRKQIAEQVHQAASPGTPDQAAAVAVLSYLTLEEAGALQEHFRARLREIDQWLETAQEVPHGHRWRISLTFLAGLLELRLGELTDARDRFTRCAEMDAAEFSPTLGTKTVDAWRHVGKIELTLGNHSAAKEAFRNGLVAAERLICRPWTEFIGSYDHPVRFGMQTLTEIADGATSCAWAIQAIEDSERSGLPVSWEQVNRGLRDALAQERSGIVQRDKWLVASFRELAEVKRSLFNPKWLLKKAAAKWARK